MSEFDKWWENNFSSEYMEDGNWQKYNLGKNEFGTSPELSDVTEFEEYAGNIAETTWNHQQQKINLMQEMIDDLWQDCLVQDEIESYEIRDMIEQLEKQLGELK